MRKENDFHRLIPNNNCEYFSFFLLMPTEELTSLEFIPLKPNNWEP
jgi:hypothetical protein